MFIIENKNGSDIVINLLEYYQINTINKEIVYRVLGLIRKVISHYLKETLQINGNFQ